MKTTQFGWLFDGQGVVGEAQSLTYYREEGVEPSYYTSLLEPELECPVDWSTYKMNAFMLSNGMIVVVAAFLNHDEVVYYQPYFINLIVKEQ